MVVRPKPVCYNFFIVISNCYSVLNISLLNRCPIFQSLGIDIKWYERAQLLNYILHEAGSDHPPDTITYS